MKQQINRFDISGRVLELGSPERISDKFSKRVLVLEVFDARGSVNEVPYEFVNANMDQLKNVRAGDWVTINHQVRARKTEKEGQPVRRFITLEGISCYIE
jgi:DNA polymerase III alpha subunit (gram-positive type)